MRRPEVVLKLIYEEGWTKMGHVWLELVVAGFGRVQYGPGFAGVLLVRFGFGVLELERQEPELQIRLWFLKARLPCGCRWKVCLER